MAEIEVEVILEIGVHVGPVACVVAHPFAIAADGNEFLQLDDVADILDDKQGQAMLLMGEKRGRNQNIQLPLSIASLQLEASLAMGAAVRVGGRNGAAKQTGLTMFAVPTALGVERAVHTAHRVARAFHAEFVAGFQRQFAGHGIVRVNSDIAIDYKNVRGDRVQDYPGQSFIC